MSPSLVPPLEYSDENTMARQRGSASSASRLSQLPPLRTLPALSALSVGSQFKRSLGELIHLLAGSESSYVRCIKPNAAKLKAGTGDGSGTGPGQEVGGSGQGDRRDAAAAKGARLPFSHSRPPLLLPSALASALLARAPRGFLVFQATRSTW